MRLTSVLIGLFVARGTPMARREVAALAVKPADKPLPSAGSLVKTATILDLSAWALVAVRRLAASAAIPAATNPRAAVVRVARVSPEPATPAAMGLPAGS